MDPERLLNGIFWEILTTLKVKTKAKMPEERWMYSGAIRNLSDSRGSMLAILSDRAVCGDEDPSLPLC